MNRSRRILGIDPGSRITGFGVIEQEGTESPRCIIGGSIFLDDKEMPVRLGKLFAQIQEVVSIYQPTELAIEQVFVHKNVRAALILGQARGVAIAATMQASIPVYEYAPKQIKQAIVGRGNAAKAQVQHMIQILLGLEAKPQVDAADALAVAVCHCHSVNSNLSNLSDLSSLPRRTRTRKRSKAWEKVAR